MSHPVQLGCWTILDHRWNIEERIKFCCGLDYSSRGVCLKNTNNLSGKCGIWEEEYDYRAYKWTGQG